MKRPPRLKGVQWISYATLAIDVCQWARFLPEDIAAVSAIPRSGLTVAHMLAAELHVPYIPIELLESRNSGFRPYCGRPLQAVNGRVLVVDDCASFGNAVKAAKQFIGRHNEAIFGAVYSRPVACSVLDHYFALHAEPDWLVVTEWNIWSHPDACWIVVDFEVLRGSDRRGGHLPRVPFAGIVAEQASPQEVEEWLLRHRCPASPIATGESLVDLYGRFPNAALLVTNDQAMRSVLARTLRPALNMDTSVIYNSGWINSERRPGQLQPDVVSEQSRSDKVPLRQSVQPEELKPENGVLADLVFDRELSIDVRHRDWMADILTLLEFDRILEIGCGDGFSASAFLMALQHGANFTAHFCDPVFRDSFRTVVGHFPTGCNAILHEISSADLILLHPDTRFDFVFVDGDHSLETVKQEAEWLLRIRPRVVMVHDSTCRIRGIGYDWCDGPEFLKWAIQDDGYLMLEDSLCRPNELTDRGMLLAVRDFETFQIVQSTFRKWCRPISASHSSS